MKLSVSAIALGTTALAAGLAAAIAPSAALAQGAAVPASTVKAGTYRVEPAHTQIVFSVLHLGFTFYSGIFSGASGSLKLDPSNPSAARFDVTVPIKSVLTTSKILDGELKGPNWFDAARYPDATFLSTSVVPTWAESAKIIGRLTLHGVTRPETLMVHFVGAGVNPLDRKYTIGFTATGLVRRSEFGVKAYVPMVGDEVRLTIAGAFERQG